jgi:hypothetical protein
LSSRAGERLAVMRRKGRVNTLLRYDPDTGAELPEAVPEDRLRDWLGGLGQGLFLAMFSLDHDALVRGGEALAQGRGDAGESLFEAGAGLTRSAPCAAGSMRGGSLFKPRASKSAIYRALADYDEARRQARDASVRPVEWTAARSAMEAASKHYEAARAEQVRLQNGSTPAGATGGHPAGRGRARTGAAAARGTDRVPLLPPSAPTERVAAVTQKDRSARAERTATQRLQQHQASWRRSRSTTPSSPMPKPSRRFTTPPPPTAKRTCRRPGPMPRSKRHRATLISSSDKSPATKGQPIRCNGSRIRRGRPDPRLITAGATLKAMHQANLNTGARRNSRSISSRRQSAAWGRRIAPTIWAPTSIRLPMMAIRKRERNSSRTRR